MNELITIPAQPAERCKFKRQQEVYFVGSSIMRPRRSVVVEHYDFKDAVRVSDCEGEQIVTVNDLVSKEEYNAMRASFLKAREASELEEKRKHLQPIIELWEQGFKTPQAMFAKSNETTCSGFALKIKSAKRWGFIS